MNKVLFSSSPYAEFYTLLCKDDPTQCCVDDCSKPRAKGRIICVAHRQRYRRWRHPEESIHNNLRISAQRRGLDFALSIQDLRDLCAGTERLQRQDPAAPRAEMLSFDRIDSRKGYVLGNVRVVTVSENAKINRAQQCAVVRGRVMRFQEYVPLREVNEFMEGSTL